MNAFDGLINRLDTNNVRTSELGEMSIEIYKTETQVEKRTKRAIEYLRTLEKLQKM